MPFPDREVLEGGDGPFHLVGHGHADAVHVYGGEVQGRLGLLIDVELSLLAEDYEP